MASSVQFYPGVLSNCIIFLEWSIVLLLYVPTASIIILPHILSYSINIFTRAPQ